MASNYKQKDNTGQLKISPKKNHEKSPDWYGRIKIGPELIERIKAGEELSLSAWTNYWASDNSMYISLKVQAVQPVQKREEPPPEQIVRVDDDAPPF